MQPTYLYFCSKQAEMIGWIVLIGASAYAFESEQSIAQINACPAVDEFFNWHNLSKGGESVRDALLDFVGMAVYNRM